MTYAVVDHATWQHARMDLLAAEKAFTKARDTLAQQRRALPWVEVDTDYAYEGPKGRVNLYELFGPRSQLIVYHFMFGEDWKQGCKSCSYWADHFDGMLPHLAARDVAFACASLVPYPVFAPFQQRMGWKFPWVSSAGTSFNPDFAVTFPAGTTGFYKYDKPVDGAGERPGLSVFAKDSHGAVFHTYSCYARGLDNLNGTYQLLDLTPKERNEEDLEWPMAWVRHHDLCETA